MYAHTGKRGRRGLAAVEMALVTPLLVLIVFGLMQFSMAFHVLHAMTNAARDAARAYAIKNNTADQAKAIALKELAGINATFTVTPTTGDCPDGEVGTQQVTVQISVPMSSVCIGIPGMPMGQTLQTKVTMRKES